MLGRTDSRRRLLVPADRLRRRLAGAGRPARRTGRSSMRERARRRGPRPDDGPDRDRRAGAATSTTGRGTVLLATTVARDRLVAAADQLTPDQRRPTADALIRFLGLDEVATAALRDRSSRAASRTSSCARGIEPEPSPSGSARRGDAKQVVGLSLESEPERVYPQAGGGPDRRLPRTCSGFVNRENVGQYGVEQFYQEHAGRLAARARRPARRERAADAGRPTVVAGTGHARRGPAADDRRGPPARARAGAPRRLDRRRGQERVGGRHRSVHRRGLRRGDYPSYDANDYRAVAATAPGRFIDPVVVERLRTRLGVQDDDRGDGPRGGHGHAHDEDQGRRDAPARWRTRPRSTTPTARAWAGSRSRTASPIRATSSPPRSPSGSATRPRESSAMLYDTWRKLGLRRQDRHRRRRRGRRHRARSGDHSRGARSTSRTPRSARASRSRRSSSRRRSRRSSTAGRPSRRTSSRPVGSARRRARRRARGARAGCRASRSEHDGPRRRRGPVLPRPDARPGLSRRWQDRHRPDLGPQGERRPRGLEAQPLQLLVRRIHRPREGRPGPRRRGPDRGGHADGRRASASWRCRSCRSSCSAGSRPTRSRRPTCCPTVPRPRRARHRTGDGGLCDTGRRDRRRPVDPGAARCARARLSSPTTWSA